MKTKLLLGLSLLITATCFAGQNDRQVPVRGDRAQLMYESLLRNGAEEIVDEGGLVMMIKTSKKTCIKLIDHNFSDGVYYECTIAAKAREAGH
ncbi:MAG: hypothetical protein PHY93_15555 [Bacteriovorax sp.]|nr:hypothetical protein [Bacteriovorax sp.]